jgi:hypothetical protein
MERNRMQDGYMQKNKNTTDMHAQDFAGHTPEQSLSVFLIVPT